MPETHRTPAAPPPARLYGTAAGKILAADVLSFVRAAWGNRAAASHHFMCFGYPVPGLKAYVTSARSFALLTPSFIGPLSWEADGVNQSAVVDETRLPLRESCFDRVLVFHALERMEDPVSFLEELWRVTAPGGRAIALVPKGKGVFSPPRFKSFLSEKGFLPAAAGGALFGLERGDGEMPALAGLLKALNPRSGHFGAAYFLVEAEKRQDNFGAARERAVKAVHARPIPS